MWFRTKDSFAQVAVVLLLGSISLAGSRPGDRPRITVLINNTARVSASVLRSSESEAGGIFRSAGLEIDWLECPPHSPMYDICNRVPSANQFVIHLVPTGRNFTDTVFGVAFLGQDGTGKYCNVFLDRIEQVNRDFSISKPALLGTVVAHELGHLLLGSQSHSSAGVMRPIWDAQSLQGIGMGRFLFTSKQSLLIKERLQKRWEVENGEGD